MAGLVKKLTGIIKNICSFLKIFPNERSRGIDFNILIEKGLTDVIENICSNLDFEDRLMLLCCHPGLLTLAKMHKSVLFGSSNVPSDDDLDSMVTFADELIKKHHCISKQNFALYIMETKNLAMFKLFQPFIAFGSLFDGPSELPSHMETIIYNFMEKVIDKNDFNTFCLIMDHLQKIRREKAKSCFWYDSANPNTHIEPLKIDYWLYPIANESYRMGRYHWNHVWDPFQRPRLIEMKMICLLNYYLLCSIAIESKNFWIDVVKILIN